MTDDQQPPTESPVFDLVCEECGVDIRFSREIESGGMTVAFYVDEKGLEQTDFHFHVPYGRLLPR
jgi:hypothetical protein